jgi:hypothetical protein
MEEETWKSLKTTGDLDGDSLQVIQELYFEQMKSVVNEDQLVPLRVRYRVRREE